MSLTVTTGIVLPASRYRRIHQAAMMSQTPARLGLPEGVPASLMVIIGTAPLECLSLPSHQMARRSLSLLRQRLRAGVSLMEIIGIVLQVCQNPQLRPEVNLLQDLRVRVKVAPVRLTETIGTALQESLSLHLHPTNPLPRSQLRMPKMRIVKPMGITGTAPREFLSPHTHLIRHLHLCQQEVRNMMHARLMGIIGTVHPVFLSPPALRLRSLPMAPAKSTRKKRSAKLTVTTGIVRQESLSLPALHLRSLLAVLVRKQKRYARLTATTGTARQELQSRHTLPARKVRKTTRQENALLMVIIGTALMASLNPQSFLTLSPQAQAMKGNVHPTATTGIVPMVLQSRLLLLQASLPAA